MKTEIINLIRALKTATTYVDGHDKKEKKLPDGVVYFVNDDLEAVCPFYHNEPYFCLNPLLLKEDGTIVLSQWSCGPTVMNNGEIEDVLKACLSSSMVATYIPLTKMASREHHIHEVLYAVQQQGQYEDDAQEEKLFHPVAIEDVQIHEWKEGKKRAFILKDGVLRKLYIDGFGDLCLSHNKLTDKVA